MIISIAATFVLAVTAFTQSTDPFPLPSQMHSHEPAIQPTALSGVLTQGVKARPGSRLLILARRERPMNGVGDWTVLNRSYETRFNITSVSSREGGDELWVIGWDGAVGEDVIERWVFTTRQKTWVMRTVGTPSPAGFQKELVVKDGTSYETIRSGNYEVQPARTRMARDTGVGPFWSSVVDPEGRYLLLLSQANSNVYHVDLTQASPLTATVLIDAAVQTALQGANSMRLVEDLSGIRRIFIQRASTDAEYDSHSFVYPDPSTLIVVLTDTANDGAFESTQVLSEVDFDSLGYNNPESFNPFFEQANPN